MSPAGRNRTHLPRLPKTPATTANNQTGTNAPDKEAMSMNKRRPDLPTDKFTTETGYELPQESP